MMRQLVGGSLVFDLVDNAGEAFEIRRGCTSIRHDEFAHQ